MYINLEHEDSMKISLKMMYINSLIQKSTDPKILKILNRAWWHEYFKINGGLRPPKDPEGRHPVQIGTGLSS